MSYLTLPELAQQMTHSSGWKNSVTRTLEQLSNVRIETKAEYDFALRHCRRLRTFRVHTSGVLDPAPLIRANAGTLEDVAVMGRAAPLPFLPECTKLTAFTFDAAGKLSRTQTQQLVAAYPRLQTVSAALDIPTLLSACPSSPRLLSPLRFLELDGAEFLPAYTPLLSAHASPALEKVILEVGVATLSSAAALLALFRAFERAPGLSEIGLHGPAGFPKPLPKKAGGEAKAAPVVQLPALRSLEVRMERGPLPLPVLSAPRLEDLCLGGAVPWLAGLADAMRRFPALTEVLLRGRLLKTQEQRDAAAEAFRAGAWSQLRVLQVEVDALSWVCSLAPLLPASLRRLTLDCHVASPAAVRCVLFRLSPHLEAFYLDEGDPFATAAQADEAERAFSSGDGTAGAAPAVFVCPRLHELSLHQQIGFSFAQALRGVSLPALEELSLGDCEDNQDVTFPLLDASRFPALKGFTVSDCEGATLSLPTPLPPLPAGLEKVSILSCLSVRSEDVAPLKERGIKVVLSDHLDFSSPTMTASDEDEEEGTGFSSAPSSADEDESSDAESSSHSSVSVFSSSS